MAEIRPLEREDLPKVAEMLHADLPTLVGHVRPSGGGVSGARPQEEIAAFLATTLLDDPWRDDELPSLVSTEEGKVIGFIGAQARRFRFGDRILRGLCATHLTVAGGSRGGAAGALLLRRFLTGPQDFSYSDTANDEVARIWSTFGGQLDHGRSFDWMVVLRPLRWIGGISAGAARRRLRSEQIPVGAFPFQAARRGSRWELEESKDVRGADAGASEITEAIPEMSRGLQLWADYDEHFLVHLFEQVEARFGRLSRRVVRRGDRAIGWYAYVPAPGGVSRILHLRVTQREAEAVLGDLVDHARENGSAVLSGRQEPQLTLALQARLPILGFARRPVLHCHDPEITAVLSSEKSLLTQLDGEWYVV